MAAAFDNSNLPARVRLGRRPARTLRERNHSLPLRALKPTGQRQSASQKVPSIFLQPQRGSRKQPVGLKIFFLRVRDDLRRQRGRGGLLVPVDALKVVADELFVE